MNICYNHTDTDCRSYYGWQYSEEECQSLFSNEVRTNLLDQEEKDAYVQDLEDLAGLPATGFDSERLLTDIQAFQRTIF
jgi:hypothetical protein